jgi:anti-repressor protein
MSNELTVFNYQNHEVRTETDENGEVWFVAKDLCDILGIENNRRTVDRLDEDEKGVTSSDTLGGNQLMTTVNESGMYSLILSSRKPEAKQFKKWVIISDILKRILIKVKNNLMHLP